jgi:amidase
MSSALRDYQIIAAEKRQQRSDKIPTAWLIAPEKFRNTNNVMDVPVTCGILTDVKREITSNYDATALLGKLEQEVWSVEQVTTAFCKRAAIAQQLVSCPPSD